MTERTVVSRAPIPEPGNRGAPYLRLVRVISKRYACNVIMLVAYAGLLANCGAYLAFGWRFPGTFRKPVGARLKAWAGVCLSAGLLIVVFVDAATAGLNNFSGAIGRWLQWLVVLPCVLIVTTFVLLWKASRVILRAGSLSVDDARTGRHAR